MQKDLLKKTKLLDIKKKIQAKEYSRLSGFERGQDATVISFIDELEINHKDIKERFVELFMMCL